MFPRRLVHDITVCWHGNTVRIEIMCILRYNVAWGKTHTRGQTPTPYCCISESGISIVENPDRIIAICCCRTVGKMTSGEQCQAATVNCGINAAGQYIPLIFLFARKKCGNTLMECYSSTIIGLHNWLWVDECRDVCALVETLTNTTKASIECEWEY